MKKLLMVALIASFISTVSANSNNSSSNLLTRANISSSNLQNTINGFGGYIAICVQNCVNDYNYCVANETGPYALQGCSAKYESCMARCGLDSGPRPR